MGCGWLGLPLAQHLISQGMYVKGSTTKPDKVPLLKDAGISPYQIKCHPQVAGDNVKEFFDSDILFLNIPFTRRLEDPTFYLEQVESVIDEVNDSKIEFVVFASSTSIYPDKEGDTLEDEKFSPETPRAKVLLKAEELILNSENFNGTVIRFAGLYGGERKIGQFLAGRMDLPNGDGPVNLIHRDDCIQIVVKIISQDVRGEIFNACSDDHPKRKDLYTLAAKKNNLPMPNFNNERNEKLKSVSNEKIKKQLGYEFLHPDPSQL